jgi:hypothetical protein
VRFILLLLLIGGLFLAWNRFGPAAPTGTSGGGSPGSGSPTAGLAPAATGDAPPKAQPDSRRGDITYEIGEAELSGQVNQQLAGRPLGRTPLGDAVLERLQLSLRSGQAEATGRARLGGVSVPVSSQLVPSIDPAGRLKVRVSQATMAGLPLPDPVRENLEASLESEIGRLINRQSLRLRSVEIGDGKLRVVGTPGA